MVGEVMDELGEGTGLSDNEQLLEKTLRDSKARGPRVLIFSNHVHCVRVVVICDTYGSLALLNASTHMGFVGQGREDQVTDLGFFITSMLITLFKCGSCVTSQHILYYCTYYSVSLTCTVHCTYYTYCTLYIGPYSLERVEITPKVFIN